MHTIYYNYYEHIYGLIVYFQIQTADFLFKFLTLTDPSDTGINDVRL